MDILDTVIFWFLAHKYIYLVYLLYTHVLMDKNSWYENDWIDINQQKIISIIEKIFAIQAYIDHIEIDKIKSIYSNEKEFTIVWAEINQSLYPIVTYIAWVASFLEIQENMIFMSKEVLRRIIHDFYTKENEVEVIDVTSDIQINYNSRRWAYIDWNLIKKYDYKINSVRAMCKIVFVLLGDITDIHQQTSQKHNDISKEELLILLAK